VPIQVIFAAIGILIVAAAPLPYGFYMLVRIVATIVFVWAAVVAVQRKRITLATVFGLVAILFSPFLKVHFDKEVWVVLDLLAAGLLMITMKRIKA
jgi:hypothetical protein